MGFKQHKGEQLMTECKLLCELITLNKQKRNKIFQIDDWSSHSAYTDKLSIEFI